MSLVDNPEIVAMQAESARARSYNGLSAQILTESYCASAQRKADDMAHTGNFSHAGGFGEEIIAWSSVISDSPTTAFDLWLGSPGHRAWVLGNATRCGWGVAHSQHGTYWVGEFTGDGTDGTGNPIPRLGRDCCSQR